MSTASVAAKSPRDTREREEARKATLGRKKDQAGPTLGRMLGYMAGGEARSKFIAGSLVRLVALIGLAAMPFIVGQGTNIFSDPDGSLDELLRWTIIGAVAGLIYLVGSLFADRMFSDLATRALSKLQIHLFSHLQTLSMSYFYKTPVGELLSRVTDDAEAVALFYEQAVGQLIRAALQITLILIVMLAINWQLTLVALLVVPVMLATMFAISRVSVPAFAKLQEELGNASGSQEETLSGNHVIISKRRQEWADAENEGNAADVYHVGTKAVFTSLL